MPPNPKIYAIAVADISKVDSRVENTETNFRGPIQDGPSFWEEYNQ